MRKINKWLRSVVELADVWFCNYCRNGYSTYAEMAACMQKCYSERYGGK